MVKPVVSGLKMLKVLMNAATIPSAAFRHVVHMCSEAGFAAFQKRVQELETSIEHQEQDHSQSSIFHDTWNVCFRFSVHVQVFATFVATANQQLDRLSEVFHSVHTMINHKSVHFAELCIVAVHFKVTSLRSQSKA